MEDVTRQDLGDVRGLERQVDVRQLDGRTYRGDGGSGLVGRCPWPQIPPEVYRHLELHYSSHPIAHLDRDPGLEHRGVGEVTQQRSRDLHQLERRRGPETDLPPHSDRPALEHATPSRQLPPQPFLDPGILPGDAHRPASTS